MRAATSQYLRVIGSYRTQQMWMICDKSKITIRLKNKNKKQKKKQEDVRCY